MTKKNFKKIFSNRSRICRLTSCNRIFKKIQVIGFDLNKNRIEELINCVDRTSEISKEELKKQI